MDKNKKCGQGQNMDGTNTKQIPRGNHILTKHIDFVTLAPDHVEIGWDGQRLGGNGSKARHHEQIHVRCYYVNIYINETKWEKKGRSNQTLEHSVILSQRRK